MTEKKTSPVGTYVFERGGLTKSESGDVEAVDHFDFCPHCDCEVPVDAEGGCLHCYRIIIKDND
jgi:hypothetical protein